MDVEQIKQWIADGEIDAVESAWLEAIEQAAPLAAMRETLEALTAAGHSEAAETLGEVLLSDAADRRPAAEALDIGRVILPLLRGGRELRQIAAAAYRQVHGQAEHFDGLLRASGLEGGQPLRRAVQTLEVCLSVRPGTYVASRYDDRVFRVAQFEPVLGCFELTAAGGETTELEPNVLADEFAPIEEGDFRVLAQFGTGDLGELLESNPGAALVGICLSRGGRIDAQALKHLLVDRYMEAGKWSKWWSRARTAAKRSELLSVEGRSPAVIRYYPHGRSLEDELAGAVDKARTPLDYLAVLQQYVREGKQRKTEPAGEFVAPLMQTLAEQAASFRQRRPAEALAASLGIEVMVRLGLPAPQAAYPTAAEALASIDRPAEAVAQLTEASLWPVALDALAARGDAGEQFARLLLLAPAGWLDEVAKRLRAAGRGETLAHAVADAMLNPTANPQLCLWLWQGPAEPVEEGPGALEILSRLLKMAEELGRDPDVDRHVRRTTFQQIRSALASRECGRFAAAVKEMNEGVARTIKRRIERSEALTETSRDTLLAVLREAHYKLFLKEKVAPWADESVLWTTEKSLYRREAELKEVLEVKMPANSRAIGLAAEHGDLSDNSDWQAAIEERRRLQARAAAMKDELARARMLQPEDVPADSVGVGSRVVLKRIADGGEVEMTFLGPLDSDAERRIYSYQTPLAQAVMGKTPGQTVTLKLDGVEGDYTIERLGSAL